MARRRESEQEDAEVDMTPMLDVTFIMLIFFIVTMSFAKPPGINVNKPKAVTTQKLAQGNIMIGITAEDQIWMNKKKLSLADVKIQIQKAIAATPKGGVVIIADKNASTAKVVKVMDRARLAGATHVWIATKAPAG